MLNNMYKLPHTDQKGSLKYIPVSETGLPKCPCIQLRYKQKLTAASCLGKLLAWRLSVPQLMAVYVIYDVGERLDPWD